VISSLRLMRLGAEQLSSMPKAYVQSLFDQYAPRFEQALVNHLADLAPALVESKRVLTDDGVLTFSLETHDGRGVILGPKLRYAHAAEYVREATSKAGFKLLTLEPASPRTENNEPVPGFHVVAERLE